MTNRFPSSSLVTEQQGNSVAGSDHQGGRLLPALCMSFATPLIPCTCPIRYLWSLASPPNASLSLCLALPYDPGLICSRHFPCQRLSLRTVGSFLEPLTTYPWVVVEIPSPLMALVSSWHVLVQKLWTLSAFFSMTAKAPECPHQYQVVIKTRADNIVKSHFLAPSAAPQSNLISETRLDTSAAAAGAPVLSL